MTVHPAAELLSTRRRELHAGLDAVVPRGADIALLDFPWHSNVGDSVIWLAAKSLFAERGSRIVYACDAYHLDAEVLRRRLGPGGVVVLNGGGNFGNLYQRHQALREQVLETLRDQAVVQMPQTVNFTTPEALDAFVAKAALHPNFSVFVRDEKSLKLLDGRMSQPVRLVPDSVLSLPAAKRSRLPERDLFLLLRKDSENNGALDAAASHGLSAVDWLDDSLDARSGISDWTSVLSRELAERVPHAPVGRLEIDGLHRRASRELARGLDLLSRGRVVITDRLHGHIVSLVHGIPNVVLNDKHGKVFGVSGLWVGEHPLVRRADSFDQALELADELLAAYPLGWDLDL